MLKDFLQVHQPEDGEEIVTRYDNWETDEENIANRQIGLTASQIENLSKLLFHCVYNSLDFRAVKELGPEVHLRFHQLVSVQPHKAYA